MYGVDNVAARYVMCAVKVGAASGFNNTCGMWPYAISARSCRWWGCQSTSAQPWCSPRPNLSFQALAQAPCISTSGNLM